MRIYIKYFAPDGTETIESIDPQEDQIKSKLKKVKS